MTEPRRNKDIDSLVPYVRDRVLQIIGALEARNFDPILFEARRSHERQLWLYGYGRTHHKGRKPVTWTMNSKHLTGKAADIISKTHGWNAPTFFQALKEEANRLRMHTIPQEACHIQWGV